jgi:cyanophycin synthetase
VILYEDQCQRGRPDGEVIGIMREGLMASKQVKKIQEFHGEFLAIDQALSQLDAGDICLILVDQVEESLAHIAKNVH